MDDRTRTRVVTGVVAALVLSVAWDLVSKLLPSAPTHPARAPAAARAAPPTTAVQGAAVTPSPAAPAADPAPASGPSYYDLLARSETRRRIRASAGVTYLNEIVAASHDSALHRWDNRVSDPVRVYLGSSTVANWRPQFLDAVRTAFQSWEATGVPVRFTLIADSLDRPDVIFEWRTKFDTVRTGQTDVVWDGEGHLQHGTITIATYDPKGQPLGPDDVRVVALHEIGHLLGLDHSPDSTDIMFPTGGARDLSRRDVQTALLLYQLVPGSLK